MHAVELAQLTPDRIALAAPTGNAGACTAHLFRLSRSIKGRFAVPSNTCPTAVHIVAATQDTPPSCATLDPLGTGSRSARQRLPFQLSATGKSDAFPTATQLEAFTHETPYRTPPTARDGSGGSNRFHDAPS